MGAPNQGKEKNQPSAGEGDSSSGEITAKLGKGKALRFIKPLPKDYAKAVSERDKRKTDKSFGRGGLKKTTSRRRHFLTKGHNLPLQGTNIPKS